MKLEFTIQRADEYSGSVYSADELAGVKYVVLLGNGDSHLFQTVADIEECLAGELWLHGYADEAAGADAGTGAGEPGDGEG